jgi:hypothetical protein
VVDHDSSVTVKLTRAAQMRALTDSCARFWCADVNDERISRAEQLLEQLLTSTDPIEMPPWISLEQEPLAAWLSEYFTRLILIDPILEALGWTGKLLRHEEHFIDKRNGSKKRIDYALRLRGANGRLKLVALIEAKHEGLVPAHGLKQVKDYADGRRERIPFVFSTNGHHYVQFDRRTKIQSGPYPLELFPTPDKLADLLLAKTYRTPK